MDNDLISRKALYKSWDTIPDETQGDERIDEMIRLTQNIPAVDTEPVRHGRWILTNNNGNGVCDQCNRQDHIDNLATHCRYCGARMDGGAQDVPSE